MKLFITAALCGAASAWRSSGHGPRGYGGNIGHDLSYGGGYGSGYTGRYAAPPSFNAYDSYESSKKYGGGSDHKFSGGDDGYYGGGYDDYDGYNNAGYSGRIKRSGFSDHGRITNVHGGLNGVKGLNGIQGGVPSP